MGSQFSDDHFHFCQKKTKQKQKTFNLRSRQRLYTEIETYCCHFKAMDVSYLSQTMLYYEGQSHAGKATDE